MLKLASEKARAETRMISGRARAEEKDGVPKLNNLSEGG